MANEKYRLIHKRSNQLVSGQPKAPASGTLEKGELAINYNDADPCLFIEKEDGSYAKFSSSQVTTDFVNEQISDAIATETARTESTYLKSFTETDPVFTASVAHGITSSDIANWNGKADSAHTHGGSQVIYDGTLIPEFAGRNMTEGMEYLTAYKQDTLVSGENIKTINGDSLLGSGNLLVTSPLLVETTYSELKSLRDNNELLPGMPYRITDYQCTTTQAGTTSAGHQFDIIVVADGVNKLNENARAALHSGDTYFANSNLGAWELKYTIDNDGSKFAWADETNGKGIIYYMKDEFDNECPYDFKNIQFYRKWNTDTQLWSDNGTASDGVAAYTFSSDGFTASITEFTDFSIDSSKYISSNIIKRRTSADNHMIDDLLRLNNICFFGDTCYFNVFGENCYNNTLTRLCRNNTFGADCYSNSLFDTSGYNTFSNGCSFNVLASYCQYNTFGDDCDYNRLGVGCSNNVFGKKCCCNDLSSGNIPMVDGGCSNNVFGSGCGDLDSKSGIILHCSSCSNIFDANIKYVELDGEYIKNYHILSSASHEGTTEGIEFTQEFLTDIVIHSINDEEIVVSFFDTYEEVQCDNVTLYYDSEYPEGVHWWAYDEDWTYFVVTDSTSDINCRVGDDIETVEYPGKLTINATPDSEVVVTVARKSNGKIVQYCEADLIADQD